MIPQTPLAVATTYFDALLSGDMATVVGLMAEDIAWHQPGDNRFSGVHVGGPAIGALTGGMAEVSGGSFRLEVIGEPMANGSLVAVPVRFSGVRGDLQMDMTGIDLLTVEEGRIVRIDLFSADQAAEDAFWGKA